MDHLKNDSKTTVIAICFVKKIRQLTIFG